MCFVQVWKKMPFIHFGLTSKHTSVTLFFLGLSYGGLFENCNEMQTHCSVPFSTHTWRMALTLRNQSSYGNCWGQCLACYNPVSVWVYTFSHLPNDQVELEQGSANPLGKGWDSRYFWLRTTQSALQLLNSAIVVWKQPYKYVHQTCLFSNKILFTKHRWGGGSRFGQWVIAADAWTRWILGSLLVFFCYHMQFWSFHQSSELGNSWKKRGTHLKDSLAGWAYYIWLIFSLGIF